jgi:hypothetical protein
MWLLTGCAGSSQSIPTISVPETSVLEATGSAATPTRPPARDELHATDPGTVALASGKVQLVEFFAYW